MRRALLAGALVLAMSFFGFGVYQAAGYLKTVTPHVQRPSQTTGPSLPGTLYVAQGGALYRYRAGVFTQITADSGWIQPAADPNGTELVAVQRSTNVSDLFLVQRTGRGAVKLMENSSTSIEWNHWAFSPRFRPDGSQLFFDFDPKDPYNNYRVDLAIFASPAGDIGQMVQWTHPNPWTGGDVNPVPLAGGGLIYTKYSIDGASMVHSQIWLQLRPGSPGVALTDAAADCLQPALSADEHQIAMVCTNGRPQVAQLVVGSFLPSTLSLGPLSARAQGQLAASPSFSPDGKAIAYLAPSTAGGGFQLWTVPATASTAPTPKQITTGVDLDATAAPVWVS